MKIPLDKQVYLICGDDEFRVELAARDLLDKLVPEAKRAFGLDVVDGRVELVSETLQMLRALRDALLAEDLFGGGDKVVWLRDPSFLCVDRVAKSEEVKNAMAPLVGRIKDGLPEGSRLVVSTTKVNRAQAFFKACAAGGQVIDTGTKLNARAQVDAAAALLDEFLPKVGLKMEHRARALFLTRVGVNSRQIVSELQKLACYCGASGEAGEDDVREVVAADATSEVWDFTDAFARRDRKALAAQIVRQLEQGESPIRLVQSVLGTIGDLLQLRDALDKGWAVPAGRGALSWDTLPPEVGEGLAASERDVRRSLAGWRLGKMLEFAQKWRVSELRAARHHALALREELVSRQLPEDFLLETRLLQAVGIVRRPAARA